MVQNLLSLVVGSEPEARIRRYHILYANATRVCRTMDPEELLGELEGYVRDYVATVAPRRVFVRAGVVGWRGKGILIPHGDESPRSALLEALVESGATRYSSEFAVLDEKGFVHPYPGHPGRPLPIGLVAVAQHREGARWRPRTLTAGRAVLELLAQTLPARYRTAAALTTLRRVVSRARTLKGACGEADEAARWLLHEGESR